MSYLMLSILYCIVSFLAGVLIGFFLAGIPESKRPELIEIPEFDKLPDQSPAQPIKTNPPLIGLYKTQYIRKGVTITENKFWAGDFWCDAKEKNLISFIQNRSWEML